MNKWYNKLFLNKVRRAVDDYNLIENGDSILVGLSGGKDSIFLIYCLDLLRKYSYLDFKITACHIDIGLDLDTENIQVFLKERNIDYIHKSIDIDKILASSSKSPCYLCAKHKRGAMAGLAKTISANKIAYGHHLTDLIDTYLLNIVKENKFRTFKALSYNEKHDLSLIRPLIYIEEDTISYVVNKEGLPLAQGKLCPYDKLNERSKVNQILEFSKDLYPDFENKMLKSFKKSGLL